MSIRKGENKDYTKKEEQGRKEKEKNKVARPFGPPYSFGQANTKCRFCVVTFPQKEHSDRFSCFQGISVYPLVNSIPRGLLGTRSY